MKSNLLFRRRALSRSIKEYMSVAAIGALALNSLALAAAENKKSFVIEEVVVTATKRGAASAQDVPIAISAFDASRLEDLGVTQFDQWAGQVPGLNFEDWGPGDKDFVIRGINSPTGATVGVYFDEAVITGRFLENGGGRQVDFKLHDIERVEVLKGPQGTLYGANSMSGTIRIIPEKPNLEELDAYIETELSDTDNAGGNNYMVNGMVNIPLVENRVGLRIVGWKHDDAGYIDNIRYNKKDVNDAEIEGARAILKFQATDNFSLTGMVQTQDVMLDNDSRITPKGVVSIGSANPLSGPAMPELMGGDNISSEFVRTPWDEEARIYGLTAEWEFENGSLTATTNLFTRDIDYIYDSTPIMIFFNAPVVAITRQIQEREVHSTEIRYASSYDGPFNFVAGLLYQEDDIDFDLQVLAADANGLPIGTFSTLDEDDLFIGSGTTIFGRTLSVASENRAVFGEVNYELSETLILTLGARYFESESESQSANTHPFFGFQGEPIDFQNRSTEDNKATFKLNLTYEPSEDILVYGNIAQGFRPGGTNAVILPINVVLPEGFDSDELISYEIGAKTTWLDKKLQLNASIYYTDWEDIQTGNAIQSFSFTDNLGEATVMGMEIDLRYRPTENWDFSIGGSWIDTELDSDEPSTVGDFPGEEGDEFPNVPNFTGFVAASYNWQVTDAMEGRVNLDYNFRGASATEFNSASPFYNNLESYGVTNLNFGVKTNNWHVSLFVRNLFDEDEAIDILDADQEQKAALILRPRTIGLRVKYQI